MKRIAHPCLLAMLLSACAGVSAQPRAASPLADNRPLSAEELFDRGMQLASAGDAIRAEQYLVLAMRAGYPRERVIVPLVRVCIASSRLRTALAHAEPFLRRDPGAWQLRYLTAAIHLALDRPAEAAAELRRVLSQRPDAAQAHYLLGVTLRDAFLDPRSARASFEAYLRYEPTGVHAPEVLAWIAERPTARAARLVPAAEAP